MGMKSALVRAVGRSWAGVLKVAVLVVLGSLALLLGGCGASEERKGAGGGDSGSRVFTVAPGAGATGEALSAFIQASPGDVIEFECGFFELDTALVLQSTENVIIRGCDMDRTVLSFRGSDSAEGILAINVRGLLIEELTVIDTPGDGVKLTGVDVVTLRRVRTMWTSADRVTTADNYLQNIIVECPDDFVVSGNSGRYGIYPVQTDNVLLDRVEAIGASDAGIYVGQTNNAIVKNSRALYNVMGYEIENTQGGEYIDNLAECNTGGFLIYDLEGLSQYGERARMYGNVARNNNTDNFTNLGGFIAAVPRGSGLIMLGYDQIDVFDNDFEDHDTASILIVSYELLGGAGDRRLDGFVEGVNIYGNRFRNAGRNPPLPNLQRVLDGDEATLLPTIVRLKNRGVGAHILWDGILDELDEDCPYPLGADGNPVPADARGKPIHTNEDPNPSCHYNAYKFDDAGKRIEPDWFICIGDNHFENGPLLRNYANFNGLNGLEVLELLDDPARLFDVEYIASVVGGLTNFFADPDMSVHDCQARFGRTLPPVPPVDLAEYTPPPADRAPPSLEEIERICDRDPGPGRINRDALAFNCPRLDQYGLFSDAADPRSQPNESGMPWVLNSRLFSDYAVKYRTAFLPPNQAAVWKDTRDGINLPLEFPVGTVLAKTFAFPDQGSGEEKVIETRLLIKRRNESGQPRWDGLPYVWETDADGRRVARLAMGGATAAVSWDYHDSDGGQRYTGSTPRYAVPHANQCITCHGNNDLTPGSPPIGLKPRHMNRTYVPESELAGLDGQRGFPRVNQLQAWRDHGLLAGGPSALDVDPETGIATNAEHLPRYTVPGDAGFPPGSDADVEARARAYLEINCQNCHNPRGVASNTGYFLDHVRTVDQSYGICKTPTAAGGGTGGRAFVIVPERASRSILPFRMTSDDTEARMPPIARSLHHAEGVALIEQWINQVVDGSYANADRCADGGGGGLLPGLLPGLFPNLR